MSFSELKQLIGQQLNDFQQIIQKKAINQTDLDLLLREAIKNKCKNFQKYFNPLIRKGANVNFVTGQSKYSNLMMACELGTLQIVECLISNDKIDLAMQDNRRQNALFYAIFNKSKNEGEQVLKLILQKNPGLINSLANNKTLLILAIEKCKLQIVRLLLNKGANPNHVIPDSGNTALHEIIKLIESKQTAANKQIMRLLIQHGADLTIKNKTGKTPLQFAKKIGEQILKYEQQIKNQKKQNLNNSEIKSKSEKEILIQSNIKNKQLFERQTKIQAVKLSEQIKKIEDFYQKKTQKINQESDSESDQNQEEDDQTCSDEDEPYLSKEQIVKQLQTQIIQFTQDCQAQYRNAQSDTQSFLERLRQICSQYNLNLQVYGSFATGLWIKNCDIDLLLIPNSEFQFKDEKLNTNLKVLSQIKRQLQKQRKVKSINLNQKIKVPMLRLQIQVDHQEYNHHGNLKTRKIDITVLDSSHNGLQIVTYIHSHIKMWPQLINLFYVIKSLTFHYKLHDPKNGGIRTYAIVIMILSFFQRVDITQIYNLGQLLMRFLYFFGYEYQYEYGYEVQSYKYNGQQKNYNNFKQQKAEFGMVLTICDPINPLSNIGKNTKAFSLQAMFKAAYISLHSNIDQINASPLKKKQETDNKSNIIKRLNFMFDTKKIMSFI